MKHYGYILSLFIFLTLNLEAKSLLYKVSSTTSTVYLLGSIHLAKPELYPLAKEIEEAYTQSDVLVLELDPTSNQSEQTIQKSMQQKGLYPAGQNLANQLSPKTYEALKSYMDKINMPMQNIEQLRPWVVMLQLSVTEMMRLGYSPELGIDEHFLRLAKQQKKPIIELETAQDQMDLLAREDKAFQDKLLFYTLESMHEMEPMLESMFRSWKNGDTQTFESIMAKPLEEDTSLQDIYDTLITKRNYKMSKKIEAFLQSNQNYFVVVGSGHVVGKEGIVELLKQKGYTLTQY